MTGGQERRGTGGGGLKRGRRSCSGPRLTSQPPSHTFKINKSLKPELTVAFFNWISSISILLSIIGIEYRISPMIYNIN